MFSMPFTFNTNVISNSDTIVVAVCKTFGDLIRAGVYCITGYYVYKLIDKPVSYYFNRDNFLLKNMTEDESIKAGVKISNIVVPTLNEFQKRQLEHNTI